MSEIYWRIPSGWSRRADIEELSDRGIALYIALLDTIDDQRSDGAVPLKKVLRLRADAADALADLVAAGLLASDDHSVYAPEWQQHVRSTEERERTHNRNVAAGRAGGLASGKSRRRKIAEASASSENEASASRGASSENEASASRGASSETKHYKTEHDSVLPRKNTRLDCRSDGPDASARPSAIAAGAGARPGASTQEAAKRLLESFGEVEE